MEKKCIIKEVDGLFQVVHLKRFRETKGVKFDVFPNDFLEPVKGVDRVIHTTFAVSPGEIGDVKRPWYMHPYQGDNLVVMYGERYVDLYSVAHGKVEKFIITPDEIYQNGVLVCTTPGMLVWPPNVFHRVESKALGSASLNFAYRYDGFDVKDNFNIYDLNTETGKYKIIREGFKDQFDV
ncbi:MAG: hypothetical protein QM489_00035 [Candidatus Izemoplasma sp.]